MRLPPHHNHLHVFVNTVFAHTIIDVSVNDRYDANIVIRVKNNDEATFRLLSAPSRPAVFAESPVHVHSNFSRHTIRGE